MIDIDQIALDTMEKVYAVDPAKLRGGDTQAKAQIQCMIHDAIKEATEAENAVMDQERSRWRLEAMKLAAHVERLTELVRRFSKAMRAYEMDVDSDFPPPRDHRVMMSDAEAVLEAKPEVSLARLKAQCWKEAYLAGMEAGHHWTVEGGYVAGGDEDAAEDYVANRQAEGGE